MESKEIKTDGKMKGCFVMWVSVMGTIGNSMTMQSIELHNVN